MGQNLALHNGIIFPIHNKMHIGSDLNIDGFDNILKCIMHQNSEVVVQVAR